MPNDVNASGPGTLTFRTWDGVNLGANHGKAVLDLVPRLDLSVPANLSPVDAGGTSSAAAFADMMSVSRVVGANIGVVAYKATGPGTWQYSLDAGGSWTDFPKTTASKGLLLPTDAMVRFIAGPEPIKPTTATLRFKAWDRTVGAEGDLIVIGGNAFSKEFETVTVAVKNVAPTFQPAAPVTLPNVRVTPKPGTGFGVGKLLPFKSVIDDSRGLKGVAIIGMDSTNGSWQYFLGGVWIDFGTVSADSAVLLSTNQKIRFVPNAGTPANTTATISYVSWDGTTGQAGDRGVDTTPAGLLNSFSDNQETATITVIG